MALTKYPEGSLRELWSIAFPLMVTSFSVMLMLFVDRLMLAHYSLEAHNAAVTATTLGWAFLFGAGALSGIAEVFVAQFNGANLKKKIGEPVWQMIWLSIGMAFCFIPLGIWGTDLFFKNPDSVMEKDCFRWLMFFGPAFPLHVALCTFFIGQGKMVLVTWLAVIANIINASLDYIFIFGVEGVIPSLGIKGAPLATFAGTMFECALLFAVFFNKQNRESFGTGKYWINLPLFWQCLKIGIPGSLFSFLELFGFALFYWLMTFMDESYITITGICQSILLLFYFFGDGIGKAAVTVGANLIGAKRFSLLPKVFLSGVKLNVCFVAVLLAVMFLFPDFLISQFLPDLDQTPQVFYQSLQTCAFITLLYLLFEGLRLLMWGLLIAAGDTLFLFLSGSLSIWIFLVLPVYLFVVVGQGSVEVASALFLCHSISGFTIYWWRFLAGKWKSIELTPI